jgi:oligopeptide/dipeptide ABC transporter ATP-binding protein
MRDGRIVELGTTDALFERPEHEYTQALLAAIPAPSPDL